MNENGGKTDRTGSDVTVFREADPCLMARTDVALGWRLHSMNPAGYSTTAAPLRLVPRLTMRPGPYWFQSIFIPVCSIHSSN